MLYVHIYYNHHFLYVDRLIKVKLSFDENISFEPSNGVNTFSTNCLDVISHEVGLDFSNVSLVFV